MNELKKLFKEANAVLGEAVKDFKALSNKKKDYDAKAAAAAAVDIAGAKVQILRVLLDSGVTLEDIQAVIPAPEVVTKKKGDK